MAAGDAKPFPLRATAYRVYFPLFDADGDLVTAATGLDSERSIDGATFADCTNEATEIATGSGMYYLDLTAAELTSDCTVVIVKTTSSGAKTTPIILYPVDVGDIDVDVTAWLGTAAATPSVAGVPEVDVTHWIGTAAATPSVAGVPEVDLTHVAGATTSVSVLATNVASTNTIVSSTGVVVGAGSKTGYELSTSGIDALFTRQLTQSYAADGVAPTVAQALFLIQQMLGDFAISGTTLTVRQLNGSATAATFTLDSSTAPTAITRTT